MMKTLRISLFIFLIAFIGKEKLIAQEDFKTEINSIISQGQFWVHWGYNRSVYSKSNIRFTGEDYDFTLHEVEATDDPDNFKASVYLNPLKFTIPQFNFRAGYFFKNNWSVSLGWDHMKYVLKNGSSANISGYIYTNDADEYYGTYDHEELLLSKDFMTYEHTDGLNYVRFNLDHFTSIYQSANDKFNLSGIYGAGAGLLFPWTDACLWEDCKPNVLHLAGYGLSANTALRFNFFQRIFLQSTVMGGFINLPDVNVSRDGDKAKQHFWFAEFHGSLGAYFRL